MAEAVTIARPYAVAVYRLARDRKALERWSEMLAFTAAVAADARVRNLIEDPRNSAADVERIFLAACGEKLDESGLNLIRLLVEYGRLSMLPQIAAIFEELKAQDEGVLEAEITAAVQPDGALIGKLVSNLETRFKSKVEARVVVDPGIIGGIKIVIGDTVIDASVRGQLQELVYTLKG